MKNNKPLISIILPVDNHAHHLRESLKSIAKQSYRNIEILAIDDFSKDGSYKILRDFAKKDKRLKVRRNVKRYGIGVTLNRLVQKAKGAYFAFMDAEDISSRDRIKKQLNYLNSDTDVVALGTQCFFIDKNEKILGKSKFSKENESIYGSPLHGVSMQFETVMINKNLLPKDVLRFDTKSNPFMYSDVFLKLLPYGKFANLRNYLHYHRNHPKAYFKDLRKNLIALIQLFIKSITLYNYSSSVRSFFAPIIKSVNF